MVQGKENGFSLKTYCRRLNRAGWAQLEVEHSAVSTNRQMCFPVLGTTHR